MSLSATDFDGRRNQSRVKRIPQNFDASLPIPKVSNGVSYKTIHGAATRKKSMELSQSGEFRKMKP